MNPHHLQLHLFDPARDQPETSPQIRQRLRPLLIMLLDEAVRGPKNKRRGMIKPDNFVDKYRQSEFNLSVRRRRSSDRGRFHQDRNALIDRACFSLREGIEVVDSKHDKTRDAGPDRRGMNAVALTFATTLALALALIAAPSLGAEIVPAPETNGLVTFTVPDDNPQPVTFSLQGWVCVKGNVDQAAKDFRYLLKNTPLNARGQVLGLDLAQALRRLTGLEIVKDPSVTVPAPGGKTLTPCFEAENWAKIMARFENLVTQTPYHLALAVPQGQQNPGDVLVRPMGEPAFISEIPDSRPDNTVLLPDGQFVTGGAPMGRLAKPRTAPAPDTDPGQPVIDKQGNLVGHLQTSPDGSTYFAPFSAPGAMPAVPQKVEVLPGGHVVWGGIPVGTIGNSDRRPVATATPDQTTSQAIYGRNAKPIGRLQTAPDGSQYFSPDTPEGTLPAEPQKVEVFPDGTIMWSGVKIGQLNKPENRATQATPVPPNPATATETQTLLPIDAEQSALAHIAVLEKSRADETAKIAAIQQQKNQINTKILGLSDSRDLDAKDKIDTLIKEAEAEWQALVKQQYRHFDKRDHLRLALESARSALPQARARAKAQHRAQLLAEFADALYGARYPQAVSSPVAALLVDLDKSLGEKPVDRIIAAFKATPEPRSPLGFLDFLRGWLEKNTSGNKTLSLEYLNAMAHILQDPARRNLWGVRVSELPALRQKTIAEIDRAIQKLAQPNSGETGSERLQRAYGAVDLHLLRLRLSKGKTRLDYTREFAAELAKLQATIVAFAPNDGDAAKMFRADYANRLRQWFVSAQASESPFGRGVAHLIAGQLGQNLARWANEGSSPNAGLGAAHLRAAQAFAAAGDSVRALSESLLAEQFGDDPTRFKARLQQLIMLRDMLARARFLNPAEKQIITQFGQGTTPHERLKNAITALLGTIAADENAPKTVSLKAALALWKAPSSRKKGHAILAEMLANAQDGEDAVPPLLAAWYALGKWPREGVGTKERTDFLADLVKDQRTLVALSRLVFAADLPNKAKLDLAHAVENLFWRNLRAQKDATARNTLIRAAIAYYKDFDGYYFQNDPDLMAATTNGTTISEAERVFSNMQYWINRLPKVERARYTGVLAFGRSISVNLAERKKAQVRLAHAGPGRSNDLDASIRRAFGEFKKGNITNAAKAFERVLRLSREQQTPDRTRALLAAIIRLVDKQEQSDLPMVFSQSVTTRNISTSMLKTMSLVTPADRKRLMSLKKPDRAALATLSKNLRVAYDRALTKALEQEVGKIILETVNGIAKISENATGEQGNTLARLRQQQGTALNRYRIFYRTKVENSPISKSELESRLVKLTREILAQERRLDALKSSLDKVTAGGNSLRKTLILEMASLNLIRARRDAIQDIWIARFPDSGNMIGTRRSNLVKTIYSEINGTNERPIDGVLEQLFTDDDPTGWTRIFLKNKLNYLRMRRRSVMMEDKTRDPSINAKAYLRELEREKVYWKKEGKRLAIGLFDLGKDQRQLALKLEYDARFVEEPTLIDQLVMSGKSGDPQKFFAFLAKLQNANLDKGLANYNKYLETPWYRLGLSQGYYLATDYTPWGSTWNYNNVLDRFTAEMNDVGAFNAALLSASRLDVSKLKKRHKKAYALLVERGFIVKGKYTLPKAFTHDAGTGLDEASKLTELDRTVNVGSAAEALVTIIIPGKLSFAGTEYIASRWIALNGLGRLGVEAALFTGYSRAGAMMLDPSLGLNQEYWTFDAVLKDYAHNLLIMGGLQGSSAIAGQFGKALRGGEALRYGAKDIMNMPFSQLGELGAREWNWFLFGGAGRVGLEAATLQAIDSATSGAPLTAEGFLRNIIFLAELKAVGMPFNKAISGLRTDLIAGGKLGKGTSDLRVFDRIEKKQNLQMLLQDHGGDWHKLVDAFKAGKVSKRTMRILTRARNGIVDGLANQVVLEIYGPERIAKQKMWDAVGSVNLTSDYDLSFKGEKSELAVLLFNERFRARWGRAMGIGGVESAGRLDTNVYTYPRYAEYGGNETDVLAQEVAAQLGVRRYSSDAAWQAHRQRLLDVLKGAERTQLQDVLDQVDRAYAEATRALDRLASGGDANAQNFAANKLYGKALKRIMDLRALYKEASSAEQAKLAQQIRNTQSKALFFASEAYLTEAAINHVVFNTQAVGRKVTADSLLSAKQVTLELPMSGNMARQSLLEQLGYLQAQFNHYNAYNGNQKQAVKLSGKLSKYFLRLLDAAHIAGVDLQPIKELVRQTVDVEANRGNAEKLAEMLPGEQAAKYDNAVKKAMEWLSTEIYRKAPVSIVEPVKMSSAGAKPTKPRMVSQRLVGGRTNTANSKPAPSARGAVYAPTGGGTPTSQTGQASQPAQGPTPSQIGHTPTPITAQPQNVVDADGTQTGWISRDPNGQAWYQPLGFPGATPPPPLKVQLLQGGQVVSQFRKLGRAVPPAKTAALKPPAKVAPPLKPAPQPQTAPGAQFPPRPGRPIIDKSGNKIGWVETDPNGQVWLVPDAPQGALAPPPQKVNVAPDGTVRLGRLRLGKLGHAAPSAKTAAAKPAVKVAPPLKPAPQPQTAPGAQLPPRPGRPIIDKSGNKIGWVETDPNGQAWLVPDAPQGTLAPPPQKVNVAPDGTVSLGRLRLGKLGHAAPSAKTAALKPTAKPTTKVVPPLKPALQPRTAPGAQSPPRPGRPIIDKSGNEVGWVETDPNGQAWLVPDAPQGALAPPPQKVNVAPDGTVRLGRLRLGKLGPKTVSLPATRKQNNATGKDQSRAVRDRDGNVMGHLQTDPNGQTWFTPNAPPGILTTPPQKVEVLGNGAILLGGRVIGQQDQGDQPRQTVKTATASGKIVTLTVKILPEIFGPKRPKPKIRVALPGAPVGSDSAPVATPTPIANDKPDDGAAKGFEGLWLGGRDTIIRHVKEGDTVHVILVYGRPDMTAFGWVIGEDTGKGTVSGRTMTGKYLLPRQMYPQCPNRVAMPFKATLDASGDRFTTSTWMMRQPDPAVCTLVPGEEWTNGLWLTRITEAEAAEIIKTSKASVDQAQAPDVSTTKVPEFNTGIPENTGVPTLPTQTYDIQSARALLNRALQNIDNTLCAGVIEGLDMTIQGYDDNLRDYEQSEPTGNPKLDELRLEILNSTKRGLSIMAQQVEQCLSMPGGPPKD